MLLQLSPGFNKSGISPSARRQAGLSPSSPSSSSWSCEYFNIRAIPPPPVSQRASSPRRLGNSSPFPKTAARVSSKRDFGTPPPGLTQRLLEDFDSAWLDNADPVTSHSRRRTEPSTYTMDLSIITSKKKIHKNASIRSQIRTKLRNAIRLAVQHGVVYDSTQKELSATGERGIQNWLLPGHIYIVHTTLDVFQLPLPALLERVCIGLQAVKVGLPLALTDTQPKLMASDGKTVKWTGLRTASLDGDPVRGRTRKERGSRFDESSVK